MYLINLSEPRGRTLALPLSALGPCLCLVEQPPERVLAPVLVEQRMGCLQNQTSVSAHKRKLQCRAARGPPRCPSPPRPRPRAETWRRTARAAPATSLARRSAARGRRTARPLRRPAGRTRQSPRRPRRTRAPPTREESRCAVARTDANAAAARLCPANASSKASCEQGSVWEVSRECLGKRLVEGVV